MVVFFFNTRLQILQLKFLLNVLAKIRKMVFEITVDDASEILIGVGLLDYCFAGGLFCQMELVVLFLPDQLFFLLVINKQTI